ncbi:quinolinate synthase A [Coraliomargarita sp. CAG:312]|nr:quinolinate synthase A [Coraliomargarita sp. CAG:312]
MQTIVFPPYNKSAKRGLSDIQKKILEMKQKRDAVILAHNYVCEEIQEIADFVGDSLGLSRQAKQTSAKTIAFAGVDFMAETAKILNPEKIVVLPDRAAGCSLEQLCDPAELQKFKNLYPEATVISYINCSAKVKELSDIICTSGNALEIVRQIPPEQQIIFCPDQHLGSWIEEKTGRKMLLWNGYCEAHTLYKAKELLELKQAFPGAPLISHPECPKDVRDVCDCVCSTEKMISFCRENPADKFIIATVVEMIHRLRREIPDKTFIAATSSGKPQQQCKNMLMNTPEKLLSCLENLSPQIELDADTIEKARAPIEKMLQMSK